MSNCRLCRRQTKLIIDFGNKPLANAFVRKPTAKEYFYPLALDFCPSCFMVQLAHTIAPRKIFNNHYQFISSTSQRMRNHFEKAALEISRLISHKEKPLVVEIGSNDGIMLKHLQKKGIRHLGIEPAGNVAALSRAKKVTVLKEFFNQKTALKILQQSGPAEVIYSANTITHIPNLNSVFQGIGSLLKKDGWLIIEDPYLLDIIKQCSFDQVYDEHVFLFSGLSLVQLAKKYQFKIVKMVHQDVHGGSMRYYFRKGLPLNYPTAVKKFLILEKKASLHKLEGYQDFCLKVKKICRELKKLLRKIKKQGKQIVGYGATAKSATLLNFAHIGPDILDYITDNTASKIGKFSPGMHIPIKSRRIFLADKPPYTLLLAWNHKKEIYTKEKEYRKNGGKFIIYFPKVMME